MVKTNNVIRPVLVGICALVVLGLFGGCAQEANNDGSATTESTAAMTSGAMANLDQAEAELVKKAAAIADAIEAAPQTAIKVLAENKISAEEFEALIYKISADENLSAAYAEIRQ